MSQDLRPCADSRTKSMAWRTVYYKIQGALDHGYTGRCGPSGHDDDVGNSSTGSQDADDLGGRGGGDVRVGHDQRDDDLGGHGGAGVGGIIVGAGHDDEVGEHAGAGGEGRRAATRPSLGRARK
jgi:hypothetical protein